MRKKTFMASIFITALLVSVVATQVVIQSAKAQDASNFNSSTFTVNIASPINGTTYNDSSLTVQLQIVGGGGSPSEDVAFSPVFVNYSLDGTINGSMPLNLTRSGLGPPLAIQWDDAGVTLQVSQGQHNLTIFSGAYNTTLNTNTIRFTVNLGIPLAISILSPLNNSTFISAGPRVSFPLTYETNEAPSWVGYSIDGSNNVTISPNDTIAELYADLDIHALTLYANDTFGNWAAPQTVHYFIEVVHNTAPTPSPPPSQQPTASPSPPAISSIAFGVVVVIAIGAGLLVYVAKHKRVKK